MSRVALFLLAACALISVEGCLNRPDPSSLAIERGTAKAKVPTRGSADGLSVTTFNVQMENASELANAIADDSSLHAADVLLLQEIQTEGAQRSTTAELGESLGMHHVYAPGYGLRRGGSHGVAILSRYPLTDPRVIELPRNHTVVNSARRVALAATIERDGTAIRLWNVHLDNRINPDDRLEQLRPVFSAIENEGYARVVLAGDLNTSPFCWLGHLVPIPCGLQTKRIESAATAAGFSLPTSGVKTTSRHLTMKLDAIYLRGLKARAVGTGDATLSDHKPLWARIEAPRTPRAR